MTIELKELKEVLEKLTSLLQKNENELKEKEKQGNEVYIKYGVDLLNSCLVNTKINNFDVEKFSELIIENYQEGEISNLIKIYDDLMPMSKTKSKQFQKRLDTFKKKT